MIRENHVRVEDLIYPMFVMFGEKQRVEIPSMPGIYQYSLDEFVIALKEVVDLGVPAVLLFGIPSVKDACGSGAYDEHGVVQEAVRLAKKHYPELYVITDVCLCEYTDHGHCGLIEEGQVLNDPTLALLARTAVSQAKAGADMVAPSDMMDGRVAAIRESLDEEGFTHIPIMAYSAKFASGFYGPFREAAGSAPQFGDRKTYQMDPPNGNEAMLETALDIEEGADIIIVKPALAYGDITYRTKQKFGLPVAAYNVSGEYAMVKAAAANGWIDEQRIVMESLVSMKRAGADLLITYHALDVARWIKGV
jgi:porphobilinogen synthase (EC 4.2.1.24)